MDRSILKQNARNQLGNKLFGDNWMYAVLVVVIMMLLSALGNIIPAVGMLIIMGPIQYGVTYLFLKQTRDGQRMDIADMFRGFTDDFGGSFLLYLMTTLFTFLWGLLFVIPGIVKGLSYSMSFYVKLDHPEYNWKQCMDASSDMMKGHKGELFVLYLSFIGWEIVGAFCLGLGTLWVNAYIQATVAQFYEGLVRMQYENVTYDQPQY